MKNINITNKTQKEQNHFFLFLETLTVIIIILALLQTVAEDLMIFLNVNKNVVMSLKISSFFFDLFFTIEFIIRFIRSLYTRKCRDYFRKGNGWIDFFASVPLLLLISIPYISGVLSTSARTVHLFNGIGFLQNAKIIKVIRISRVLRFLRILKITGKKENRSSYMTQRHLNRILVISVVTLTISFASVSILRNLNIIPSSLSQTIAEEQSFNDYFRKAENYVQTDSLEKNFRDIAEVYPSIVYLHYGDVEFIRNELQMNEAGVEFDQAAIENINRLQTGWYKTYTPLDNMKVIYSRYGELQNEAVTNLIYFFIILVILISFLLFYAPHFNKNIGKPINEMLEGFVQRNNITSVGINKQHKQDEIFQLANNYNNRWIKAKKRALLEK